MPIAIKNEYCFFDALKETLPIQPYQHLIKCVYIYMEQIITLNELRDLIEPVCY